MELSCTIDGVTIYTKAPEHAEGCSRPGYFCSVSDSEIVWVCNDCGATTKVDRLGEPEMEDMDGH